MTTLRLFTLSVLLGFSAVPALAETPLACNPQREIAPTLVLDQLARFLGNDVSISSADEEILINGFVAASREDPSLATDIASIIVAGRPELVEPLRGQVERLCPDQASAIMQEVEESATSPSPEDLAALVNEEGAAPAAGDDGEDDPVVAEEEDTFDPVLNDPDNNGSPS